MKADVRLQVFLSDDSMYENVLTVSCKTEEAFINRLIIECANCLYQRGIRTEQITDIKYSY